MIKKYTFAGLIIILPLVITFWLVKVLVNFLTQPFEAFTSELLEKFGFQTSGFWVWSHEQLLSWTSKFFILIFITFLIIAIGMLARRFFVRAMVHAFHAILSNIPFVKRIYLACKDFTDAIFSPHKKSFQQVVIVPFPSKGLWGIGLVTATLGPNSRIPTEEPSVSVLIPGTPNPFMGFLFVYPKSEIYAVDMKVDEALKYLISCGSSIPKSALEAGNLNGIPLHKLG